jgi:membrane protein required for colicin V production
MNWLDIVIIIALLLSAVSGLMNGLIKSLFSLAGLIIGIILARHYYTALAGYLTFIPDLSAARIAAFVIILVAVGIVATILGALFTRIISTISLGWLNRLGGAVFGVILGAVFIAAILSLWAKYGGSSVVSDSALATLLVARLPLVLALLPAEFDVVRQYFQ